ncbi:hypothetical protein J2S78_002093 [Salibacterium salarium]|uniref:hypothetical protein n=1 Tax=Salibacterium salarium TaxID=284579 RepID=UPI00278B86ED|nr:hypothetical protein [Salibacterium salarium]MDQ0299673.1 hypothetical protein [Salibacterium salarium]
MTVESAIHFRGQKVPWELWEQRKAQLMQLYEQNKQKLKEMEVESYGTETTDAHKGA